MLASRQHKAQTSLYRACKNNQPQRAKAAIELGANIDLPDNTPGANRPLHIAAMFGAAHLIALLSDSGADLQGTNQRGRTALDVARRVGEKEAAALLEALVEGRRVHLEGSGDDDEEDDGQQVAQSSLFDACRTDDSSRAADALVGGADVEAVDASSNAPLHVAAIYGSTQVIDLLVFHYASLESRSGKGLTPLELARANDQPRAASLLEELIDRRANPALPAGPAAGPPGGALQAMDGTVAFGEAPHPGELQPQPVEVDVFAANGHQHIPQRVRTRGG